MLSLVLSAHKALPRCGFPRISFSLNYQERNCFDFPNSHGRSPGTCWDVTGFCPSQLSAPWPQSAVKSPVTFGFQPWKTGLAQQNSATLVPVPGQAPSPALETDRKAEKTGEKRCFYWKKHGTTSLPPYSLEESVRSFVATIT